MIDEVFVIGKIQGITDDLALLKELEKQKIEEIFADQMTHHAFNNIMQQIIQRAVDINQHIIIDADPAKMKSPKTYRETFELMGEVGVLSEKLAHDIAGSGSLRNILVHDYDEVDTSKMDEGRKLALKQYPEYCREILNFIGKS